MSRLTLTRPAAPNPSADRPPIDGGERNERPVLSIARRNEDAFAYGVLACSALLFVAFGLFQSAPRELLAGLRRIISSTSVLITDYVALGGAGAAFVNAGLLMLASVGLLLLLRAPFRGITVAAVFLMGSFGLFGKNVYNVWPIVLGTWIYARLHREPFSEHVYTALFATCLAPVVTECVFVLALPGGWGFALGALVGVGAGLVIAPLAAHLKSVHQGFSLYNVGFTAGVLGTVIVSLLRSYGYRPGVNLLWSTGNDALFSAFLCALFALFLLLGLLSSARPLAALRGIFGETGQSAADFAARYGIGAVLVNMGVNGLVATAYVLLVGGPLNGPTIGGILTIAGFGACGKHAKNVVPVLAGVVLGSLTKVWNIDDPAVLLAALFGTSLAPVSGHYGWGWGVVAGFLNSSVALCSGVLHGGMNLYNTGFSAGIVAAFLVPLMEALARGKPPEQEAAR